MSAKALCDLSPQDKDVNIQVQVNRKWEFKGNVDDGAVLHIDMIFTDAMRNAIYAEIPSTLIAEKGPLLEVGKVYNIRRFRVTRAKSSFRVSNAPFMIFITIYSIIEVCRDPPSTFPLYVYNLASYDAVDPYGPKTKDFHDVLGMITEVTEIKPIQLAARPSTSYYRSIFIKDLSDNTMKVTLWGDRAFQFSYESVYDPEKQNTIVVLFVGCLAKEFGGATYLSGGTACHWYFNPAIKEAEPYYERILSEKITLHLPPISNERINLPNPPKREHKDLKDLLQYEPFNFPDEGCECTVTITKIPDNKIWWYPACNRCPNKPSMQFAKSGCPQCGSTDSVLRYKLTFMASDGTAEASMFCFDGIAKRIVGKSCASMISSVTNTSLIPQDLTSTSLIPPDLAAIVSLKFTFVVVYNDISYHNPDKEFLIKTIVTAHGRTRSLPQLQRSIEPLYPSTPTKSLAMASPIDSPSIAMSRLSTSASQSVTRKLTYSPTKDTISLKSVQDNKTTSQSTESNVGAQDQNRCSFESPPKRAKQKDSKFRDEDDTLKDAES